MKTSFKTYTIIIILLVFISLTGFKFWSNLEKIHTLEQKANLLQKKIKVEKEKNNNLNKQIYNINDPEYVEKVAREKLGLVKPGEILLIPVEQDDKKKNN